MRIRMVRLLADDCMHINICLIIFMSQQEKRSILAYDSGLFSSGNFVAL